VTVSMIIDTDPGVDDAVALMLAAASPEVQLLAVTTVYGNASLEVTTVNALRLRAFARLDQLPVAAGATRPLVYPHDQPAEGRHGVDGLGGRADLLPDPIGPIDSRGAVALASGLLNAAADPVTLVALGPLTNIALLLAAHPETKPRIDRIVIMGGYLGGLPAESNIRADPEAAHRVLVEEQMPVTLVPLDLTRRGPVGAAWIVELAAAGPRCAALAGVIAHYQDVRQVPVALHDSLAVLEAAVRGSLVTAPMALDVVCGHGATRGTVAVTGSAQSTDRRAVQVAVDADLPSLNALILNRLRVLQ
jgi:pyrimidine-specific ribonucleoside hydrolase